MSDYDLYMADVIHEEQKMEKFMKLEEIKKLIGNIEYKQMQYQKDRKIEILFEGTYKNYQFYILNLGTHPTAYVNIPITSKLFGKEYDDIYYMDLDIDVHGGLTYSDKNLYLNNKNAEGWFIGWDYAHYDDYAGYEEMFPKDLKTGGKKWTTEEIFEDVVNCIESINNFDLLQNLKDVKEKENE